MKNFSMGRKVQITKEQMLEAGLQIIIREGYEAVAIKTVAKELNCSTQPISWSFGNIEGYWKELQQYALDYFRKKMLAEGEKMASYRTTIEVYVDTAIEEPNLIRYLRFNKETMNATGGIGAVFDDKKNQLYKSYWAKSLSMTEEDALSFMKFFTTYTDGIVSLLLSDTISIDEVVAKKMLDEAEVAYKLFLQSKKNNES